MQVSTSVFASGPPSISTWSYLCFTVLLQEHPCYHLSLSLCLSLSLSLPPSLSHTHTNSQTPTPFPSLSLSLSFSLTACEKLLLLFSVCAHAGTYKTKKTIWLCLHELDRPHTSMHTGTCGEHTHTHTPEPHLTQWVVENSPDFTSLNSATICNKVEKGVLFNLGLKEWEWKVGTVMKAKHAGAFTTLF